MQVGILRVHLSAGGHDAYVTSHPLLQQTTTPFGLIVSLYFLIQVLATK